MPKSSSSSSSASTPTPALDQLLPATVRRRQNSGSQASTSSPSSSTSSSTSSTSPDNVDDDFTALALALEGRDLWLRDRGRVLSGCEPVEVTGQKKLKIALLMSGGVDSSVALHLLTEAGHDVWPFYLKIWFEEDFRNSWSSCPWEEDVEAAQAVLDCVHERKKKEKEKEGLSGNNNDGEEEKRPLTLVPLTQHYWRRVVDSAISDLKKGRTPNPDVLCNSRVKFGAFVEMLRAGEVEGFAKKKKKQDDDDGNGGGEEEEGLLGCGFDRVASGHYASLIRGGPDSNSPSSSLPTPLLGVAKDAAKDQTYFLARLSSRQLSAALFPLGALEKREVRALAAAAGLPNAARADSQGLCFLGKVRFDEFVAAHLGKWPGPLVEEVEEEEEVEEKDDNDEDETETTTTPKPARKRKTKLKKSIVGFHDGAWFFTPGQRKGIGLSGGPWFVTRKDMRTNSVFVSRSYKVHAHHSELERARVEREGELLEERRRKFVVGSLEWLPGCDGGDGDNWSCKEAAMELSRRGKLRVKVRHGPSSYWCTLEEMEEVEVEEASSGFGNESDSSSSSSLRLRVSLDRHDQGLAPGQFAVFYDDERGVCVGSGVIEASGGEEGEEEESDDE